MNKLLLSTFLISSIFFSSNTSNYSSTSVVTVVGSIIKTTNIESETKKHKRKDCPVCKGKGWYISGDGIAKISCQYCEP